MRRYDLWMSVLWFVVSIATCLHALQLGLGSIHSLGPGFIFFWTGVILGLLSIALFIRSLREKRGEGSEEDGGMFGNVNWPKKMAVIVSLTIYAVVYERLGFLISTFLLLGFLLYSIEAKKWYVVVSVAFVSTLLTYVLFVVVLQTRLPKGILWI
jgi:putative tricarboxylic transport membrane protein